MAEVPVPPSTLGRGPAVSLRLPAVVRAGRVRESWLQLLAFSAIGAVGAVVNLAVYVGQITLAGVAPLVAATVAFCVAVSHNYLANRWVTFRRQRSGFASQGARFAVVSAVALGVNLGLLALLLGVMQSIPAQILAIGVAMPVNFLGNKLWSFAGGAS
jgi:dolichol-phosphate mannosyltransferase